MAVRVKSSKLRAEADALQTLLTNFVSYTNNMIGSCRDLRPLWKGDASNRFQNQVDVDAERFQALVNAISSYIQALRWAADEYDKAEQKAQDVQKQKTVRKSQPVG
jgi:WXG100 family type VII secretion target